MASGSVLRRLALAVVVTALALGPSPASAQGGRGNGLGDTLLNVIEERIAELERLVQTPNPARGLVFDGLEIARNGVCRGMFRVVVTGQCTHGPDPAPPGSDVRVGATAPLVYTLNAPPRPWPCVGDGMSGKRYQIIYAYRAGEPNRLPELRSFFEGVAQRLEGALALSATSTGGPAPQFLFETDAACNLVIHAEEVPGTDTTSSARALVSRGYYTSPDRNVLLLLDGDEGCGMAGLRLDENPGPTNRNNAGGQGGNVWRGCWGGYAEMHELGHTLGAVQASAPHVTSTFHCRDEWDVMCYGESNEPTFTACSDQARESLYDCNNDDYFYAGTPPPGHYLATHWNIYNSVFLYGNGQGGPSPPADSIPPSPPGGLAATAVNTSQVSLTWSASSDNVGVASYRVYRNDRGPTPIAQVSGTTYTDSGLTAATTYSYYVVAQDSAGNSSPPSGGAAATTKSWCILFLCF